MSMQNTIQELVQSGLTSGPVTAYLNCLTLHGKIDERDALKGLSRREHAILGALLQRRPGAEGIETEFVLSMRPHGRIAVLPHEQYALYEKGLTEVMRFSLSGAEFEDICRAQVEDLRLLQAGEEILAAFFQEEGYANVAARLDQAARNMAPLIFFIGDVCVSNFYNIGKGDVPWECEVHHALKVLAESGPEASLVVRTFAFCFAMLLRSGTYTRAEEMNSCQLSMETLSAHFLDVYDSYRQVSAKDCMERHAFSALPLAQQAGILAELRGRRQQTGIFVRDINGLNLLKKERYFHHDIADPELAQAARDKEAKQLVEALVSEDTGRGFEWSEGMVLRLAGTDGKVFQDHPFDSDVEYLIDLIIRKAIKATGSDVGMSRGTRDIARFTEAWLRQDTLGVCEWSQAEYYCHAVASTALQELLPAKKMTMLINAVSSRMRYNTWHYAPGYFKAEDIPASRGWFQAPRMADIAEWSDHHHAGHVHAAVRYSIRSPKAIRVQGQLLPGLTDLRLMRQAGRRYTLADLAQAIKYTDALGFVYQHLVDAINGGLVHFEFKFGSKAWIDAYYASLADDVLTAV
jgi:hypothetical protein